jgi:4'-phosphopantetheinyl transferase
MRSNNVSAKSKHDGSWSPAPSTFVFPANRIDVWRVRLDETVNSETETTILSPDEIDRANRFHFERDRNRFSRCRSALRQLIASYLSIASADIRFDYLASGKPQLAGDQNPRGLQFNVSHSAEMALIAVGSEHRIGIDIERIRTDVDTIALAARCFSQRERDGLRELPLPLRTSGFYACWTRKEAFLKATGDGLSFPLENFSVTTDPEFEPAIEEIRGDAELGKQWLLMDLVVDGYRAALAVDHTCPCLETYAWN